MSDDSNDGSSEHGDQNSQFSLKFSNNFPQNTPVSIKLSEDNFLIWKQHVLSAVRGYGLEGYLTGEQAAPPQTITSKNTTQQRPNPDFLNWNMQDQRLAHWIQSSLSETIMILVVGLSTSHEIWQALEKSFAHQSRAKVMQYKIRLQTLKKESLSMRAFLSQVKSCCDLLGAAGCKISEEDQIMHILSGLGTDYNPVMVTVTSKTEGWTVQDVSAILMSYESRLEEIKSSSISADASLPSAHLVQSNQRSNLSSNNNNYRNDGGRGSNFRGRGGRYGGRGGRSGGKIICQLCQKPGHGADKCWYRYEQNFVPNAPQIRNQNPASHGSYQMNHAANVAQIRGQNYFQNASHAPAQQTPSEYNIDASSSTSWYPDSGATNHISHDFGNLNSASEYRGGKLLHLGDGNGISIKHVGNSVFKSSSHHSSRSLFLHNLLHVPQISKNLLSVSQFAKDNDVFFEFHPTFCFVRDQVTKEIILKGTLDHGLYHFFLHKSNSSSKSSSSAISASFNKDKSSVPVSSSKSLASISPLALASSSTAVVSLELWHKRLGHCAFDTVKQALTNCNVPFHSIKSNELCKSCCVAKAHRLPYESSTTVYSKPLELVHSDLWGPSPVISRNGFKYYVTFIDHYSRFTWLFLLKAKSDVESAFKLFKNLADNQLNAKIKTLQSDWGGEFQGLSDFLASSGIAHRVSCPYTPQQNGLAERKHRHIIEMALSMLSQAGLATRFWDDAVVTATYLINRLPTALLKFISPFEKLHKIKPNYSVLRSFGCLCYPFTRPYNKHKLEFRSTPSIFLGYSTSHKGYKALLPSGKLIVTRDIIFDESVFPNLSSPSPSNITASSPNLSAFTPPHDASSLPSIIPSTFSTPHHHDSGGIHLCQAAYIKELLNRVQMLDCKPYPTPMLTNLKLSKNDGDPFMNGKLYRSTVGALQYAAITRPEISFSVNKVSQFMASPLDVHWKAVKRILRYLAGTMDYGLHFQRSDSTLIAFSDSDWAADLDDRKSVTGYCVYYGKNLISWSSKKQAIVSRSSTEAEYRSLAQAACEVTWIAGLLDELGVAYAKTPVIWVDNMSTIALASNPVLHARTKHIEIDVHFVRDKVKEKKVELRYVPTIDQTADILTKPLGCQFFSRLRNKLSICSLSGIELRGSVNIAILEPCSVQAGARNVKLKSHVHKDVKDAKVAKVDDLEKPPQPAPSWKDILMSGNCSLVKSSSIHST